MSEVMFKIAASMVIMTALPIMGLTIVYSNDRQTKLVVVLDYVFSAIFILGLLIGSIGLVVDIWS